MEKRTLLAVAICMGILLIWWRLFPPTTPPPAHTPAPGVTSTTTGHGTTTAGTPGLPGSARPGERPPEQEVTLDGGGARYVLSSYGGTLRDVYMQEPRFLRDRKDPRSGYDIIGTTSPETWPMRTTFSANDFPSPEEGAWTVSQPGPNEVVFHTENDQVALDKHYRLDGAFRLQLSVTLQNKSDKPISGSLALHVYGHQDPDKKSTGFWNATASSISNLICYAGGKVQRTAIEPLLKEPKENVGVIDWVASDDKYFAVAAVPEPEPAGAGGERKCGRRAFDPLNGEAYVSFASRTVPPHAQTNYGFIVYAGPKYASELEQIRPRGRDVEARKLVDVTFAVLSKPLLWLLKLFQSWVGNWGVAIIMLTLFVKLVTFYPNQRAMMSGRKMQRLGPKLQELRKKFENDKQRLGVETMALYKKEGVSPVGGCLPSLITMPIWIALFSTLNYAVELHRVPFFGYIHDLSARDPYFITPLLMGAAMVWQMRMAPAGADPQQQKMMSVMMPVMFTGFSLFLPAGLALYTLTNSLLTMLQQFVVNKMDKNAPDKSGTTKSGTTKTGSRAAAARG